MDVLAVKQYLETKSTRVKLESQLAKLTEQLTTVRGDEETLSGKIDPNSFITTKTVKVVNELLSSRRPLWLKNFPVSFVGARFNNGHLHLSIVFSQPIFQGWRTEKPYKSFQSCPLSLETPIPPDENHIPMYIQVSDNDMDVICWEQNETVVKLWLDEKRGIEFRWENNP
jgi:hypothetical protein